MNGTIFIQIASYRDKELALTIQDCLAKASQPERLRFGICHQFDSETENDLDQFVNDQRFRIDRIDHMQSEGCCWARNRTNKLYADEEFTLQIDAHMRFAENWDQLCIQMLESLDCAKPILSTYPPGYSVINGKVILDEDVPPQGLRLKRLNRDLTTSQEGAPIAKDCRHPGKSPLLAAGFLFTLGRFCREVEYDPGLYFAGEEVALAARAFTHGYDFFYPHVNVVWHLYNHYNPLHWSDHPEVSTQRYQATCERLQQLLITQTGIPTEYALGKVRTLAEFEAYAEIDFSLAGVRSAGASPVRFNQTISLNNSEIPRRNDYALWVFALFNEEDEEIYRQDIHDPEILSHSTNQLLIDAELPDVPTSYLLWPKHADFGERLVYPLPQSGPDFSTFHNLADSFAIKPDNSTIFIAIAAYREPELKLTVASCLEAAHSPERLRFGICLQYDNGGESELHENCLEEYESDLRFRVVKYPYTDSEGGCWARNITQSLYRGERYTLQIDSHSRMAKNWDVELIRMMREFPSDKPLITGFPPLYHRRGEDDILIDLDHPERVPTTTIEHWSPEGWIHHPTQYIAANQDTPRPTRVISGAFVFTVGAWNSEVNQDPLHLYTGEEFALTLRSFTSGYDLFNPDRIVLWHRNHPQANRKYITDFDSDAVRNRHQVAVKRLQKLLQGDQGNQLGAYGLGYQRTLEQYKAFSGLDCTTHEISQDARAGNPPVPNSTSMRKANSATGMELELTVHIEGMAPHSLVCDRTSTVLGELQQALRENFSSSKPAASKIMFLKSTNPHREVFFLQSRLQYFETRLIN